MNEIKKRRKKYYLRQLVQNKIQDKNVLVFSTAIVAVGS